MSGGALVQLPTDRTGELAAAVGESGRGAAGFNACARARQTPITDEASLQKAIAAIEKQYRVAGLLLVSRTRQVTERAIRGYRGQPARVEQDIRYQVQVKRDEAAIEWGAVPGWLAYLPDQCAAGVAFFDRGRAGLPRPVYRGERFSPSQRQDALHTPVCVQRDDHAQGLFHLLSLAARLLALGDYTARRAWPTNSQN
ncbi:MAG: hypothetical protein IPH82_16895 [Chloroflexi bacterium]|nr:hypothetical protein [Chloroflexota bacterium]